MPRSETWWAQKMEDARVARDQAIRDLFPPDVIRNLKRLRPYRCPFCGSPFGCEMKGREIPNE